MRVEQGGEEAEERRGGYRKGDLAILVLVELTDKVGRLLDGLRLGDLALVAQPEHLKSSE